jgi:hypothetical protein
VVVLLQVTLVPLFWSVGLASWTFTDCPLSDLLVSGRLVFLPVDDVRLPVDDPRRVWSPALAPVVLASSAVVAEGGAATRASLRCQLAGIVASLDPLPPAG